VTDDPDTDTTGGLSKRTLIRLLVGISIGVPLVVEGATFLELFRRQLGGEGDGDTATTGTATPSAEAVGVGDDLLPSTDRSETLAEAVLRERDADGWPLTLTVDVTNDAETAYEFQLLTVTLDDGRSVGGRASTGRLAPGERGSVTGEWSIPAGSTPAAVDVVALVYPAGDGSVETIERRVDLAKIPVRGG
jgi:hypothetical protein